MSAVLAVAVLGLATRAEPGSIARAQILSILVQAAPQYSSLGGSPPTSGGNPTLLRWSANSRRH